MAEWNKKEVLGTAKQPRPAPFVLPLFEFRFIEWMFIKQKNANQKQTGPC